MATARDDLKRVAQLQQSDESFVTHTGIEKKHISQVISFQEFPLRHLNYSFYIESKKCEFNTDKQLTYIKTVFITKFVHRSNTLQS